MTDPILEDESPSGRPTPRVLELDDEAKALRDFAVVAARDMTDGKCTDVLVLDVRGLSPITNYVLIASGTSDKQMQAVGRDIVELAEKHDLERYGTDADEATTWVVLDFVDVMVHLFEPMTRAHYDLEMMWGDAERVNWRKLERDAQEAE